MNRRSTKLVWHLVALCCGLSPLFASAGELSGQPLPWRVRANAAGTEVTIVRPYQRIGGTIVAHETYFRGTRVVGHGRVVVWPSGRSANRGTRDGHPFALETVPNGRGELRTYSVNPKQVRPGSYQPPVEPEPRAGKVFLGG